MTRRSAGEGNIRQRPNGLWEARYTAADGRPRSLYARTKREASDRLRDALGQAQAGILPVDRRLTTADYLDAWLETLRSGRVPLTATAASSTATSSPPSAACRWRSSIPTTSS